MEDMRIVLEEIGNFPVGDDEFMLDILLKLPEGKEGELLPYQLERKLIEPKINDLNQTYTIENLSRDLDRLYNSINKKEGKVETKKTPEREQLEMAYKAVMKRHFKGRCRKCGVFRHTAVDCRKKIGNGNRSGGFEGNKGKGPRGNFNKKTIKCYNCGLLGHMAKDCHKPKHEKMDRANKTVAGQIAYMVRDEEITEKEWKKRARESLMHEDGWGDVESGSEDESEDNEDKLQTSEGLEDLGGLLLRETELPKPTRLQDLISFPTEQQSLEVPL
jgi:hypothetical protein